MELWNCGIICYIALGPTHPRDPPKKIIWKWGSSGNFEGGTVTNNSTIPQFHSLHWGETPQTRNFAGVGEKTRNAAWQCGFPATLRAEMQCATLQLQCGVFATLPCCISGGWPAGREMQHGSVGFGPPCGHKCSVPRCNCSVGFLPHCHAAFLGGRGGHKPGFQISYFSDSDLFLGFWPFGLVKGAFGTKRDPKRAKRKIGMELWNCGIICYIALGPKSPRDPPKKQNWKPKSSEDSGGGGNVTNNSTIQQFHSLH